METCQKLFVLNKKAGGAQKERSLARRALFPPTALKVGRARVVSLLGLLGEILEVAVLISSYDCRRIFTISHSYCLNCIFIVRYLGKEVSVGSLCFIPP